MTDRPELVQTEVLENCLDAIILSRPDGTFLYANAAACEIFGYTLDELMMLGRSAVVDTSDPRFIEALEQRYRTGRFQGVFTMKRKDASRFPAAISSGAYTDINGEQRISTVVRDITQEEQKEVASQKREKQLAESQRIAQIGSWEHDMQTHRLVWSDEMFHLLGLDPKQDQADYQTFFNMVHPDDRMAISKATEQTVQLGKPYSIEYRLVSRDGKDRIIHAQAELIHDHTGKHVILSGTAQDITERKRADLYRDLSGEVFQILNESVDFKDSIRRILAVLKQATGCDAAGIRLESGDDYPYFVELGFPGDFLLTENTLVHRDSSGGICRNPDGRVKLECTCGLVIAGQTDPANPLFTPGGSFWTNDSLPSLDIPAGQDLRLHSRNECIHQGFASVALIPIHTQHRIVGLLQLNARRKSRFNIDVISALERIANHIGEAWLRNQMGEALKETEERHKTILHTAMDGFWRLDLQGRLLEVNATYCRMSGYSERELLAMSITDLEAAEIPTETAARIQKILTQGEDRFETWHRRKDGSRFAVEISTQYKPGAGGHLVVFLRDITERKRVEVALKQSRDELTDALANYRAIFDSANDAIFIHDLQTGAILDVNRRMTEIYGYSVEEARQLDVNALSAGTPPYTQTEAMRLLKKAVDGEPQLFEWLAKDKAGRLIWVEVNIKRSTLGANERLLAIVRDITERKRIEDDLHLSQEELRALAGRLISAKEEENKRLARELHDTVSQRLAVLGMDVSALEKTLRSNSAQKSLHLLGDQIGKLGHDVHELSRQMHPSLLYDLGLTVALKTECSAFSRQHGIAAEFTATGVPDCLPGELSLNIYRIAQESLWNLAKHARAQNVRLTLAQVGGELVLTVEDDGIGFDYSQIKGKGSLGLVSMEERARLVQGSFSIQSQPGKGTRVEARIPLPLT